MKENIYENIITQLRGLVEGERDEIGVMANAAALLAAELGHHWTGFYLVRECCAGGGRDGADGCGTAGRKELRLGPFQGPVACYRIGYGKGVCGTAWARCETVVVPDVDAFPGHIACSSLSRSEIVVPLFRKDAGAALAADAAETRTRAEVAAVLDIDSAQLGTFDETDRLYLERICKIISETIY